MNNNINNINDIFDNRTPGIRNSNPRNYDVRITLNKSGDVGFVVRFGFHNNAVKAFAGKKYIQISKIEALQDKIYFRTFDDKRYVDVRKLCTNSKSSSSNRYVTVKPSETAEKIYRSKWINKTFNIQFDEFHGLYFIQLEDE